MTLGVIARLAAIAFIAALATSLAFYGLLLIDGTVDAMVYSALYGALVGSYTIGFPVALLTFQFSAKHMAQSPSVLVMIAALSAIMLVLASFAIGDANAAYWLGLPSVAAVLTYAALGWLWIIRPIRNTLKTPPQDKELA